MAARVLSTHIVHAPVFSRMWPKASNELAGAQTDVSETDGSPPAATMQALLECLILSPQSARMWASNSSNMHVALYKVLLTE